MAPPHHRHYHGAATLGTRAGERGPAAPPPRVAQGHQAAAAHSHAPWGPAARGPGEPSPQALWVGACPPARRNFTKSVPTGPRRGGGRGTSPTTLQPRPVGGERASSCSGGTQAQRGLRARPRAVSACSPSSRTPARGERRLLLVFPQQSRNKQTMATRLSCAEAQGGAGRAGAWARAGGRDPTTLRPPQGSGLSPRAGRCPPGCLPGRGWAAGVGRSSSSSDGGCSRD